MRRAGLIAGLVLLPGALGAQAARELQIQGTGVVTATQFFGAGLGFALRSGGRTRVGLSIAVGDVQGALGGRGDILLSYHLLPYRRRGVTPYAGGGVSVVATSDQTAEYLVIMVGVEATPGRSSGWFIEGGLGGGVLINAGMRLRFRSRRR